MLKISGLLLLCAIIFNTLLAKDRDCWVYDNLSLLYQDSKTTEVLDSRPIEFFIDSMPYYSQAYYRLKKEYGGFKDSLNRFKCKIDTVGYYYNHLVIDLFYSADLERTNVKGKATIINKIKEEYSLLKVYFDVGFNIFPKQSRIISWDTIQILESKSKLGGQNWWYVTHYWLWDYDSKCPCKMEFKDEPYQKFNNDIPDGFSILHGIGFFSADSLFSHGITGKENSHYRWKSGGTYRIWYKAENCNLIPIKKTYNHEEKQGH